MKSLRSVLQRIQQPCVNRLAFLARLAPCLIGIEACATAHHWARELVALGHQVGLVSPSYVKAYLKRVKNDAADAEAICEAVRRPSMRFVLVRSEEYHTYSLLAVDFSLPVSRRTNCSARSECDAEASGVANAS